MKLNVDGNPISDKGMLWLMKSFVYRLKVRTGGAFTDSFTKSGDDVDVLVKKGSTTQDGVVEEDDFMKATEGLGPLEFDLEEDLVMHQCKRKAPGPEPVLRELSANDCGLTDSSMKFLMIFVKTGRLPCLRIGGANGMSLAMRQEIHNYNLRVAEVQNINRGFVSVKMPIYF